MWFRRGDDGLTNRQRRKAAARFWKVANTPISQEARDRARDPNRKVVRLQRQESGPGSVNIQAGGDIGDHEHIVELSMGDKARLIEWLRTGTGAWHPQSSSRLTVESVAHGGIFIRTKPWTYPGN